MPMRPHPAALSASCAALLLAAAVLASGCTPARGEAPPSRQVAVPDPFAATALPNGFAFPDHDTVRVMTWNVENLVDLHPNPYNSAGLESRPDTANLRERYRTIVAVLEQIRPDVVVFQEVEGAPLLQAEVARGRLSGLGYRHFAAADRGDWHQNVVVMSRLPLGVVRSFGPVHTPVPGIAARSGEEEVQSLVNHRMLVVDVLAREGAWFTLAAAHLKAGVTARDRAHRRGQLAALLAELSRTTALHPEAPIVMAGDLNLTPREPEHALLAEGEGSLRFTDVLAGTGMLTHPTDAPVRQLDYLFLNPSMGRRLVAGSGRTATPLPVGDMTLASDHLPVVADFIFSR